MRRLAWVCIAIAIAFAGCEASGQGNALGLCSAVCHCVAPGLPGQQRACVDECVADGDVGEVSSACEECVFENSSSCDDLLTRCEQPCSRPMPIPEPMPQGAGAGSDDL